MIGLELRAQHGRVELSLDIDSIEKGLFLVMKELSYVLGDDTE